MDIDVTLSALFVDFYNSQKGKGKTYIPCTNVAKRVMLLLYEQFIVQGLLIPIEQLSLEEKKKLVNECRLMENIFYTNKSLIENSKILYVINLINENS